MKTGTRNFDRAWPDSDSDSYPYPDADAYSSSNYDAYSSASRRSTYYGYSLQNASDIKTIVTHGAGVGKIGF